MWQWPFFEPHHAQVAARATKWAGVDEDGAETRLEAVCRKVAASLGDAGLLDSVVPDVAGGGRFDLRAACLVREALAYRSVLADSVFAMQGIGSAPLLMFGTEEQQARWLPGIRSGRRIAGFALTEPGSGSDVAGIETTARRDGDCYVLNGRKTFISNAPFADHYIVLARTGKAPGARGLTAFLVEAGAPGLVCGAPVELIATHPVGPLTFEDCRVDAAAMIGEPGQGFRVAMATFNFYRTSVRAAALGLARRARDLALERVTQRHLFGAPMSAMDRVRRTLADMEIALTTGGLAVYSAAWLKDSGTGRSISEAAIAKYVGTENGWAVIDAAVQLFGGLGVTRGSEVERLFREARAMRIYEGASEVQKLIIGREVLRAAGEAA